MSSIQKGFAFEQSPSSFNGPEAKRAKMEMGTADSIANANGNSQQGQSNIGSAAIPTKTAQTDGTVDTTPDYFFEDSVERTFTFNGVTFMNNVASVLPGPTTPVDSNQWVSFAWEFPSLWLNEVLKTEFVTQFQQWKPISCTVTFADAQNYTQINSGDPPIMIPSFNSKMYSFTDNGYFAGPTFQPWGLGEAFTNSEPKVGPLNMTAAQVQTYLRQLYISFTQGGYFGDQIQFLPNQYNFGSDQSPQYLYLNQGYPGMKTMRMGSGHSMTHTWHYNNMYWRDSYELGFNPISVITNPTQIGTTTLPNGATVWTTTTNPRADETFGYTKTLGLFSTFVPYSYTYAVNSGANSAPWTGSRNGWTNFANQVGGTTTPLGTGQWFQGPGLPQPKLFLHFQPDIGVVGTAGQSNVQLNFSISYTIRLRGKMPILNGTTSINGTGTSVLNSLNTVFKYRRHNNFPTFTPFDPYTSQFIGPP